RKDDGCQGLARCIPSANLLAESEQEFPGLNKEGSAPPEEGKPRLIASLLPLRQSTAPLVHPGVEGLFIGFIIDGAENESGADPEHQAANNCHTRTAFHVDEDFVEYGDKIDHQASKSHRKIKANSQHTTKGHRDQAQNDHGQVKR